jgi:hypothetical protein
MRQVIVLMPEFVQRALSLLLGIPLAQHFLFIHYLLGISLVCGLVQVCDACHAGIRRENGALLLTQREGEGES